MSAANERVCDFSQSNHSELMNLLVNFNLLLIEND